MKRYSFLFLICICCSSIFAQDVDSTLVALQNKIKIATTDTTKIEALYETGMYFFEKGNPEALAYFEEGLLLINNSAKTEVLQRQKINYLSRIGGILRKKGEYEVSLKKYQEAQKTAHQLNDLFLVAELNHNIGNLFGDKGEHKKAIKYFLKAIKTKENYTDTLSLAHSYSVIGVFYRKSNKLDSALYYYDKATIRYNQLQKKDAKIAMKSNMAVIHIKQKNYQVAIPLLKEAISFNKSNNNIESLAKAYYNIARPFQKQKKYTKAIQYLDSALTLAKQNNLKPNIVKIYRERKNIFFRMKEYKRAYRNAKRYKQYSDSIFNNKTSQRIAAIEYEHKLELEKIENELALKKEQEHVAFAKKERLIYGILFIFTLLFGVIITVLIRKNNTQRVALISSKKNMAELALITRESELKKVVIDNTLREEIQLQVLDEVKQIIKIENEHERKSAIKSLSALLLSNHLEQQSSAEIYKQVNDVHLDFKVILDTHFSILSKKEKEILYLMKSGLNTNEIKAIQNTTVASVKSSRYRIRKKLNLSSSDDIIAHIETYS